MAEAALITGAAKRVGKAIALALARDGLDVAVHYNGSEAEARGTAEEVRALGRRCELFKADLRSAGQTARLMPEVFAKLPNCNVLINNASVFHRAGLLETSEDEFDANFAIHLKAPLVLTQAFARVCKAGAVINILDAKISKPGVNYFAYTLSKKALADFTLMAASALAPGIRVNGICPGMILAPEGTEPDCLDKLARKLVPLRRAGHGGQIADAVVFLLRQDYVTGQILYVDGGEHLGTQSC